MSDRICGTCFGSGKFSDTACFKCNGTGTHAEKEIDWKPIEPQRDPVGEVLTASVRLEKLKLEDGDMLVMTLPENAEPHPGYHDAVRRHFNRVLEEMGVKVTPVIIQHGVKLERLPTATLLEAMTMVPTLPAVAFEHVVEFHKQRRINGNLLARRAMNLLPKGIANEADSVVGHIVQSVCNAIAHALNTQEDEDQ